MNRERWGSEPSFLPETHLSEHHYEGKREGGRGSRRGRGGRGRIGEREGGEKGKVAYTNRCNGIFVGVLGLEATPCHT